MSSPISGVSCGAGSSPRDDSHYEAHNLIMKFSASMALKAVLELCIPDILASAEGKRPLSIVEILAQLPTKSTPGPKSICNLRRLFNPLVREGFFSESLNGERQPVYGLTKVSNWFVRDNKSNLTLIADLQLHPVSLGCWDRLHELFLDETTNPFVEAHGLPVFEYCNTADTEFGALVHDGMVSYLQFHKDNLMDDLQRSGVLHGVNTLVDVGGGWGPTVGVKHVAGNYMEAVPSGDAMLLKVIIHNHGDQEAIHILQNCLRALPQNGKVIIVEYIVNRQDSPTIAIYKESVDLILLAHAPGAGERTKEEHLGLLAAAGFKRSNVIQNPGSYDFVESFKL